jgi:hypothetical protein
MGLKDINYKQLLLDRGERIGLGAAGVITLFLVATLFFPGMGFMSGSSGSNADALDKAAKTVESGIANNKPTQEDAPGDTTKKLVAFKFDILDAAKTKQYAVAGLFEPGRTGPPTRQMPELFQPKESAVAVVRLQLPSLAFSQNFQQVLVLDDPSLNGAAGGNKMGYSMPNGKQLDALYGGQQGPKGQSNPSNFNPSAALKTPAGKRRHRNIFLGKDDGTGEGDYRSIFVDIGKISSVADKKIAEQAYPVRAAEIVAAFPYKAQVQEFQDKLGLSSSTQVLSEPSLETNKDKAQLRAFRFLGVRLERRQVDAEGKPIDEQGKKVDAKDGWAEIDLEDGFKTLIIRDARRFEDEDPKLLPVILDRILVMRKLLTFGDRRVPPVDEYPKIEEELPGLKATMDTLNKNPNLVPAGPSLTNRDFSVFDIESGAGAGSSTPRPGGSGSPSPALTPSTPPPGFGGARPFNPSSFASPGSSADKGAAGAYGAYGAGGLQAGQEYTIPEYCLIRLFDVTVEPGKTYEYRMQVRMGNPNFDRPDAASQGFARLLELPAKDWYVLPEKVTVPQDLYYYAVDQAKLDAVAPKEPNQPKEPKEAKLPVQPVKENQTVLQIQKWLEVLKTKREEQPIGEWVIAERVVATRGEPIGPQKVEVPYWRSTQDRFTMLVEGPQKGRFRGPPTVEVPFSEGDEPVLVDFTGGDATYKRTQPNGAGQALPVTDKGAAVEVLLLMPDGTLAAHDSAKDAIEAKRVSRLKEEREWIHNVKNTKGGKEQSTPFGT